MPACRALTRSLLVDSVRGAAENWFSSRSIIVRSHFDRDNAKLTSYIPLGGNTALDIWTGSNTSLSQTVIATSEHVAKQTDNMTRMAIEITTLRVLLQSTREELRAARGSNTDETGR